MEDDWRTDSGKNQDFGAGAFAARLTSAKLFDRHVGVPPSDAVDRPGHSREVWRLSAHVRRRPPPGHGFRHSRRPRTVTGVGFVAHVRNAAYDINSRRLKSSRKVPERPRIGTSQWISE
jgi:hypothetical protein